jgi:hypothetical protein
MVNFNTFNTNLTLKLTLGLTIIQFIHLYDEPGINKPMHHKGWMIWTENTSLLKAFHWVQVLANHVG